MRPIVRKVQYIQAKEALALGKSFFQPSNFLLWNILAQYFYFPSCLSSQLGNSITSKLLDFLFCLFFKNFEDSKTFKCHYPVPLPYTCTFLVFLDFCTILFSNKANDYHLLFLNSLPFPVRSRFLCLFLSVYLPSHHWIHHCKANYESSPTHLFVWKCNIQISAPEKNKTKQKLPVRQSYHHHSIPPHTLAHW